MFKYLLGLFFVLCFLIDAAAQQIKLRRINLSEKYTATYNCSVDELYKVVQGNDSVDETEWVISNATLDIEQDILEKKKNYQLVDYKIFNFYRKDSIRKANGLVDTMTNMGKTPLVKVIFQYTRQGGFLGPTVELNAQLQQMRDFKYMYNRSKNLMFNISYLNSALADTMLKRTDTLFHAGFDLVVNHSFKVHIGKRLDTLGLKCFELFFDSYGGTFTGSDNMMKALGLSAIHSGSAKVQGRMLVDEQTGRLVFYDEFGNFDGTVTVKTGTESFNWPSAYIYQRKMVLNTLIKKPRKKIFGIF
ncbi:MAG: hypothetical protein ACO1PI_02880 [Bacteroidota bacterium]